MNANRGFFEGNKWEGGGRKKWMTGGEFNLSILYACMKTE
jgi:hypothetical protein